MKKFIVPANGEALLRAAKALFGDEGVQSLQQAYKALDEAMTFAYEQGVAQAEIDAKAKAEDTASENEAQMSFLFDEGVRAGYNQRAAEGNESAEQDAYDDGYVDGVDDARNDPEEANDYMAFLSERDAYVSPYFDPSEYTTCTCGEETDTVRINAQVEGFNYDEAVYGTVDSGDENDTSAFDKRSTR